MNRKMLLILCTALIGAGAAGCSGGDTSDAAVNSGTYVIDSDAAEGSFLPSITLDETEQSYHIVYDPLSATYIGGTYATDGDVITCKTIDGDNTYLFRIGDENTLTFIQNGSSDLKPALEEFTVPVTDGSVFKLE